MRAVASIRMIVCSACGSPDRSPGRPRRSPEKENDMLKKARAEAKADAGGAKEHADPRDFSQNLKDSSRQIWLAGLGAFSRAQAEGMKVFESLVEQGRTLESRTKRAATDTATAAAGMAAQKAKEVQAMAGGTWDKLEQVFEERVARALSKLGVHTQADVERLAQRVESLSEAVNELIKAQGGRAPGATNRPVKKQGKRASRPGPTPGEGDGKGGSASSAPRKRSRSKGGAGGD
jgi:poly(hydroxyalkanoate) granule-associated protein